MRNLKRALSLALASVMLMGMMVVGASAASYPDVDADKHDIEAIDVLEAIGLMQGDKGTGNFRPDDKVTRNEMAVVMAKLILGTYEADSYTGVHPFTDVPSWADKYVAACYAAGIINGTSETTYSGTSNVTAVQAAAMMLRALGYEDLSKNAAKWDVPVAAKANQINLFKGMTGSGTAQLTRNEIAKLTLNTLQADVVTTEREGGVEVPGVVTIPAKITYKTVEVSDKYAAAIDDTEGEGAKGCVVQLGEKLYKGDLRLAKNTPDDFGNSVRKWSYKAREINASVNEPDVTYTKEVKLSDIYKDLGLSDPVAYDDVYFYHNGRGEGSGITDNSTAPVALSGLGLAKGVDNKIGGNGVLIQVWYDTDHEKATVTIINTYVAQVASYNSSKEELTLKNVTGAVALTSVVTDSKKLTLSADDFDGLDGYAKDDYVLVTVAEGEIKTIKAAEPTTGDVSSYVDGKSVTVDGKKYEYTKGYEALAATYKLNSEFDLYVDDYGYVIFAEGVEADDDYLYVTKAAMTGGVGGGAEIKFIRTDGTEDTGVIHNDTATSIASSALTGGSGSDITAVDNSKLSGHWYKFEMKSGKYVLSDPSARGAEGTVSATNDIVKNGKTTVTYNTGSTLTIIGNDNTVFIVKKGGDITVYTGVKNVPDVSVTANSAKVGVIKDKDNASYAKYVLIDAAKADLNTSGSVAGERIFIVDSVRKQVSETSDNKKLYTYEAVRTGVEEKDGIVATSNTYQPGLYMDVSYDGEYVDSMTLVDDAVTDESLKRYDAIGLDVKVINNALNVTGVGEILADDCKVFITDGDDLTETDASGLDAKYTSTDKLTGYVWTVIDNKKIIEIYVVEDETRPAPGSETAPTVQAFEATEAEDQTFTITGTIVSGTPDEAKGAFTDADMGKLGQDYFVAAVTLPGTKAVNEAYGGGAGTNSNARYAVRVTSAANDPDNWDDFPWGEDGTNDVTLYGGVKRFRGVADYESSSLAVLMLPGTTAKIEVMLMADEGKVDLKYDNKLEWNTEAAADKFDSKFVADYTITIDASGLTCVAP